MGEYATRTADGAHIKIGTCENMYYLRWDQRHLVTDSDTPLLDPAVLGGIRFRFPWPDEDNIAPGGFEDHDKGLAVDTMPPVGIKHYAYRETDEPCGRADIVQQAWRDGKLVTIGKCRGCGARFGYYDEHANALLDELSGKAERSPVGSDIREIALRVALGYNLTDWRECRNTGWSRPAIVGG